MRLSTEKFIALLRTVADGDGHRVASYSGRAMYGRRCVALFTDSGSFDIFEMGVKLAYEAHEDDDENGLEDLTDFLRRRSMRADNFGLGMVYYWPEVEWPETMEDDEEEDED